MIPFYIYSGSLAHAFNYILHNRIINFPHLLYIDKNQLNNVDRCIIVVASDKQNLLNRLQKIAAQEDDKLILKSSDTFVYSLLTTPGYEKLEANLFDNLNRFGIAKIAKLPKNVIMLSQSQEDHKFLINILKPKYIFPINGLYMDFVKYKKIAKTCFNNNTIILNNGQKAIFDGDKLINIKQHLKIVEQYVGTNGLYDVGVNGLIECEQMSDSGCVLASLLIDKKAKQIKCSNYNIVGIINTNDPKNQSIINEINSTLNTAMLDLLNQRNSDANLTREEQDYFKKQIAKQYDKKFDKRPLVLLSIIYNDQLQKANNY
jgi:ribonuclease J